MGSAMGNLLYLPLPVILNQNRQDASLYILQRHGGGNRIDESNVTVALCLETQNLGAVETLLRVQQGELSLQFRVDDPQIRAFIQPRLPAISKLSFPAQYRYAGASIVLRDAPLTPANAGQVMQRTFGIPASGGLDISV